MVKALHRAGIEVILDVVYNHTAEGNHLGPTLSFQRRRQRGATTGSMPETRATTWTSRAPATRSTPCNPSVLRLIMDSLRYFVIECHVDGFRFDLASALARELYDVDRLSAFFDVIHQDPVLSQVKLIAEPWDVGPGGYQVGNFPILWSEWNGMYRDTMRDFWRGHTAVAEFARRFTGSSDLYQADGRTRPRRSTSSRATTASRFATSSRTSASTTRRTSRTTTTGRTTTARGTAASRARPTTPPSTSCATGRAELPRHAPALAGRRRCCSPGDELAEHAVRQQQRLLPGQRALVARAGSSASATRALLAVHAGGCCPPCRAPGLPALRLPHRRGAAGLGGARRLVVPARRTADDAGRLGARRRLRARRLPERRRDPDADRGRRADRGRLVPRALQRLARARDVRAAAGPLRPSLGARALHGRSRARAERRRRSSPARHVPVEARRCASWRVG